MSDIMTFDPVLFSIAENKFLLDQLGNPWIVARNALPPTVNARAVEPIVRRIHELELLKAQEGTEWVGVEAVKSKITDYLRENAKWKADAQRSKRAPRFPSLYSFDGKGRAARGGVGSDSGRVRTFFKDGKRVPFEIVLQGEQFDTWVPPTVGDDVTSGSKLVVNNAENRIECGICGRTESFKPESKSSYSAARARMSKHLRKATKQVEEHRELHQQEFT